METQIKHYPLRLPMALYKKIKYRSQQEERSFNNMLIRLLRKALHDEHESESIFYQQTPDTHSLHIAKE